MTNRNLDSIISNNLIVNTNMSKQPILFSNSLDQVVSNNSWSGNVFNSWSDRNSHLITLLYNDSALLSVPYLVQTLTNFYSRLDGKPIIDATLSPWPRTTANIIQNAIDYSSFTALIVLGTGLVLPLVTFAVEIVADREVGLHHTF